MGLIEAISNIPIVGDVIGGAAGLLMEKHNDRRQYFQQKRLQGLQMRGQKEMTEFNNQQALKMWEDTNYSAQVEQLRKAGLNTGLMYKSAGTGGTSQVTPGSVTGGQAPGMAGEAMMAAQFGLQTQMAKAQIENVKADTKLKETEATKKGGADTENVQAETDRIKQETTNAAINAAILTLQKEYQQIQNSTATKTQESIIKELAAAADKAVYEAITAGAQAKIDNATIREQIKQIRQTTTEQQLRIATQKANIQITEAQIQKIANDINMARQANMRQWDQMSQQDRDRATRQLTEQNQNQGLGEIIRTIFTLGMIETGTPAAIGFQY